MRSRHGIRRRDALCPECGHIFSISWRAGVKRFQAPLERCPECDHVSRRSAFSRPTLDDYDNQEVD